MRYVQGLSLCVVGEGMDGIWVMGMQSASSLIGFTSCSEEELLLYWGTFGVLVYFGAFKVPPLVP